LCSLKIIKLNTIQFVHDFAVVEIKDRTLIRPVASYGTETWTMTKEEEKAVLIFESKIFRRIHGPKYGTGN
jgi:hypothetical protein